MRVLSVLFTLALLPAAAHAATVDDFTLTYFNYDYPGQTEIETFSLPSRPTPDCAAAGGANCVANQYFILDNIPVTIAGDPDPTADGPGTDTATFYTTTYQDANYYNYSIDTSLGGVTAYQGSQQYFSGPVSSPTFIPGIYDVSYSMDGSTLDGTVSIVQEAAATPEPSNIMLLGTGVLSLAGALRRRANA